MSADPPPPPGTPPDPGGPGPSSIGDSAGRAVTPDDRASASVRSAGMRIAAVVAVLVVVALVALALQRSPAQLDPTTPEGTVQAWLQSLADGDPRLDLLDQAGCTAPIDVHEPHDPFRAVVVDTDVDGDVATVDLAVTERFGDGPFDDGYTHDERYDLRRGDGGWEITGYDWPWNHCMREGN